MNLPQGYGRQQQADLSRVNERLQQQRLGLQNTLSQDTLAAQERLKGNQFSFMERREDQYPDLSQMIQLMQGLGGTENNTGAGGSSYAGGSSGSYSPWARKKITTSGHIPFGGNTYAKRNEPRRTEFAKSFAERLKPKPTTTPKKSASSPSWFDSSKYRTS